MRTRRALLLLAPTAALLSALALALGLGGRSGQSSPSSGAAVAGARSRFDGAELPAGMAAPDFTLADQSGRAVSLAAYRGRVTLLTFLYSTCGASCVLIAQQIRGALDELALPVPVLVVSADPRADTPARVRRFLQSVALAGRVEYLSRPSAQLPAVWRAYHVTPARADPAAFARAATVLLVDRRGRERVVFGLEQLTPEALAHDIRTLAAG